MLTGGEKKEATGEQAIPPQVKEANTEQATTTAVTQGPGPSVTATPKEPIPTNNCACTPVYWVDRSLGWLFWLSLSFALIGLGFGALKKC